LFRPENGKMHNYVIFHPIKLSCRRVVTSLKVTLLLSVTEHYLMKAEKNNKFSKSSQWKVLKEGEKALLYLENFLQLTMSIL